VISELFKEMRPKQWVKNLFVIAALIFARRFIYFDDVIKSIFALLSFIAASSFIYIINDIVDLQNDRSHPVKSKRPLASGKIKIKYAIFFSFILLFLSVLFPFIPLLFNMDINYVFFVVLFLYIIFTLAYTFYFKNFVIIDVLIIASGFVLRAIGGAVIISVPISSWFLITAMLLSLFLALVKRRQEIIYSNGEFNRNVLEHYSKELLDQLVGIVCAATIVTYSLYTMERSNEFLMPLSIVFVIYGIFRYLYLMHRQGEGEIPEKIIFTDIPFLINLALYATFIFVIILFNPEVFK